MNSGEGPWPFAATCINWLTPYFASAVMATQNGTHWMSLVAE